MQRTQKNPKQSRRPTAVIGRALTAVVCLGLVGALVSGCALVTVNPERDRAQVIATINGKQLTKAVYNNTMANTAIYYAVNGQTMPTGSDLKDLQKNTFDAVIQNQVLAAKAKKDKLKVNEASAKKTGAITYQAVKKQAAKKYAGILKNYSTNDKLFAQFMQDNTVTTEYASKALAAYRKQLKKHPYRFLDKSVGTVDKKKVTHGEYYYYYVGKVLSTYASTGSAPATDKATQKRINQSVFKTIGTYRGMIQYCKDHHIKISSDAVAAQQKLLNMTLKMYFPKDSTLDSYLQNYGMTAAIFRKYQKEEAKGRAAQAAIRSALAKDVKVSNQDVKEYYESHESTYNPKTVSACHILTKDPVLAKKIAKEAKGIKTKAAFEKLMRKYSTKTNKKVLESMDLGAFKSARMVPAFSKAAFNASKNTAVGPVKTTNGYHVIFVYDKTQKKDSWKNHKAAITQSIQQNESKKAYQKQIKDLQDVKADVDDEIKNLTADYVDQLKKELHVKTYEKRI
ncbi:SurA N-terminal domain-containing protein [Pseudoramibacter alactolyticus]|uniref:SurA N-terminal domain-containing protein n=1 Tax=Pseudoramibacter alactolyticus TaxID=113287 RepID=UPI00248EDD30|nr:SurA N-terminal domain-containing protein [Pseudoramibacter alactolyticus]